MAHAILPAPRSIPGLRLKLSHDFWRACRRHRRALLSGAVSVRDPKEDTSLAAFYLISLALGGLIVSLRGSSIDLMHVLSAPCSRSTTSAD